MKIQKSFDLLWKSYSSG